MPQLDPTWFASQLFWLAVSLTVLFFVLSRAVLPSLMSVLEARREAREGDLALAQQFKTEAEAARQQYEAALAESRTRSQAIFAEAEARSKQAAETALAELNRSLSARIEEAEKRIERSKQELFAAVQPALAGLVAAAVEKVTDVKPSDAQVKNALQQIIR